jgi:hypothetical protein
MGRPEYIGAARYASTPSKKLIAIETTPARIVFNP